MSKPLNPAEAFFMKHSAVIFVVLAAITILIVIFISYNTYISATSPDSASTKSTVPTSFDKQTVQHINQLHSSADAPDPTLPSGRNSPFVE